MPQPKRQGYRELREEEIDAILQKLEAFVSDERKRLIPSTGDGGFSCCICESEERNAITRQLLYGVGYGTVAKQFKLRWNYVWNHYRNHIKPFIPPLENPIAEIAKGVSTRTPFPINAAERTQWVWIAHQQMVARQLVVDSLEWQDPEMCKLAISMARAYSAVIAQISHAIPNLRRIEDGRRKGKSAEQLGDELTEKQKHELRIAKKYRDFIKTTREVTGHVDSGRKLERAASGVGPAAPKPKEERPVGATCEPDTGDTANDSGVGREGLSEAPSGIAEPNGSLDRTDEETPKTHV